MDPTSLADAARTHLERARTADHGRSAHTVRIRLTAGRQTLEAAASDLLTVPATAHTLLAVEDSALLLTVSVVLGAPDALAGSAAGPAYSWQEGWA